MKVVNVWKPVSVISDYVQVVCNRKGFSINGFNGLNNVMIESVIPKSSFIDYVCPTPVQFAISTVSLLKICSNNKDSILSLAFIEHLGGKLQLDFRKNDGNVASYELKVVDHNPEIPGELAVDFTNSFQIDHIVLKDIIAQCRSFSKYVSIDCRPNEIHFSTETDGFVSSNCVIKLMAENVNGRHALHQLSVDEPCQTKYFIKNLYKVLCKSNLKKGDSIYCFTGKELPLLVHAQWLETGINKFFIAPAVDSN